MRRGTTARRCAPHGRACQQPFQGCFRGRVYWLTRHAHLQAVRVSALQRLFRLKKESERLYRHQIFAALAEHEKAAWALGFTNGQGPETRERALQQGSNLRPESDLIVTWTGALAAAFDGLKLQHQRGSLDQRWRPNGWWTTDLEFIRRREDAALRELFGEVE